MFGKNALVMVCAVAFLAGADPGHHGGENHNQTVSKGLLKSKVKGGKADGPDGTNVPNHNQKVARRAR